MKDGVDTSPFWSDQPTLVPKRVTMATYVRIWPIKWLAVCGEPVVSFIPIQLLYSDSSSWKR